MTDRMKMETPDLTEKNIEKIAELFPNCITESKDENGNLKKAINFDILKQMLSKEIVDGDEAYEFTWVGKKAAMLEANKPIRKTLRPCPEESLNWDTTQNLYIEGDNLDVLKLLQESYLGKVKMIYIDPPYNTGNDFIYKDDFAQSLDEYEAESGQVDEEGNRLFKNSETNGRFHSDWCSMMYSRLMVARNLLSDDGVIFISIDDNEVDNLSKIVSDIYGDDNFICKFIWKSKLGKVGTTSTISATHEYIVCYAKEITNVHFKMIENKSEGRKENLRQWGIGDRREDRPSMFYPIEINGVSVLPIKDDGTEGRWRVGQEMAKELLDNGMLELSYKNGKYNIYRYFSSSISNSPYDTLLFDKIGTTANGAKLLKSLEMDRCFSFSKPVELIRHFIFLNTKDNDLILDFFSGSATTAHAVMQLNAEDGGNRKFIMVQLQEPCDEKSEAYKAGFKNICEIGKERIRRAGKKILEEKGIPTARQSAPSVTSCHLPQSTIWGGSENNEDAPQKQCFGGAVEQSSTEGAALQSNAVTEGVLFKETNNDRPLSALRATSPNSKALGADLVDVGFRVFKLADSNMKDVYYSADEYSQQSLQDFVSNIKEDRTDLDLLFGCLLEWGLPLSMPYSSEKINGFNVHTYNDGDLIACFDENISEEVIKIIAKRNPLRAVFRDSSFANSPSKINVTEIFKLLSPNTRVKVI